MNTQTSIRSASITGILGTLLLIAGLPVLSMATPSALPPRPTPLPTPTPTPTPQPPSIPAPPTGGYIVLRATSAQTEMWTIVQWQDALGDWHDVTGWQGTFDEIVAGTGVKTWWVAEANFGQGPFRWVVYQEFGGRQLAVSEPFDLPDVAGEWVVVEMGP
jgi:hypothetical protein